MGGNQGRFTVNDVPGRIHAVFTVSIRSEYAKLINIDSPSPDTVRPLRLFVGCEIERDRQARTLKLTQQGYIRKLVERFEGEFTPNDLPYGASKAKREAFEALRPGTEESAVDKAGYLVRRGSIGWPICMTRPECAFTYSVLCSLSMYPTAEAHAAAMHVVGYLVGTAEMGPIYGGRLKVPSASPRDANVVRREQRAIRDDGQLLRQVGTTVWWARRHSYECSCRLVEQGLQDSRARQHRRGRDGAGVPRDQGVACRTEPRHCLPHGTCCLERVGQQRGHPTC